MTSLIRSKEEKMCVCVCGGRGHSVPHFMELFLIPLGASIGYLRVCGRARGLLFQLGRPALCCAEWHYGIRGGQVKQCVLWQLGESEHHRAHSLSVFM